MKVLMTLYGYTEIRPVMDYEAYAARAASSTEGSAAS